MVGVTIPAPPSLIRLTEASNNLQESNDGEVNVITGCAVWTTKTRFPIPKHIMNGQVRIKGDIRCQYAGDEVFIRVLKDNKEIDEGAAQSNTTTTYQTKTFSSIPIHGDNELQLQFKSTTSFYYYRNLQIYADEVVVTQEAWAWLNP